MKQSNAEQQDDLELFISSFQSSDSEVASTFEESLRKKFLQKSTKSKLHSFNYKFINMKILGMVGVFIATFVFLSLVIAYTVSLPSGVLDTSKIIQQANAQNGTLLFDNSSLLSTQDKTYTYMKRNITIGDKYDECVNIRNFPKYATRYESYRYYAADLQALPLTKNVGYDSEGKIVDYFLHNREYSITYIGGDYAVKVVHGNDDFVEPDNTANTEVITSETTITPQKEYFPAEAAVKEEKDFYTAEWSNEVLCNEGSKEQVTVFTKSWLNKDNYKAVKNAFYIDSVSDENLIYLSELDFDSKIVEETQVADIFQNELNIELKDMSDFQVQEGDDPFDTLEEQLALTQEFKTNAIDYLVSNPTVALKFTGFDTFIRTVDAPSKRKTSVPDDPFAYLQDRNFYPAGQLGDELYGKFIAESNKESDAPGLIYSYQYRASEIETKVVGMSVYEGGKDVDLLVQESLYEFYRDGDAQVTIDGNVYTARLYKRQILALYDPSVVIGEMLAVAFEYEGKIFVISSIEAQHLDKINFETVVIPDRAAAEAFVREGFPNF